MTGNSLEVINGPGWWRGSGFRSYVDMEMGRAFRIPRALIALCDSDSSDRGGLPAMEVSDRRRRRKWRHTVARAASGTSPVAETSSSSDRAI